MRLRELVESFPAVGSGMAQLRPPNCRSLGWLFVSVHVDPQDTMPSDCGRRMSKVDNTLKDPLLAQTCLPFVRLLWQTGCKQRLLRYSHAQCKYTCVASFGLSVGSLVRRLRPANGIDIGSTWTQQPGVNVGQHLQIPVVITEGSAAKARVPSFKLRWPSLPCTQN